MTGLPCCLCCTKWLRWLAFGVPFCRDCSTSSACLLSTRTLEYKSGSAKASSRVLILVSRSFNFSCSAAGFAPNRFRLGAWQFPKNKEESYSSAVSGGNWNRIEILQTAVKSTNFLGLMSRVQHDIQKSSRLKSRHIIWFSEGIRLLQNHIQDLAHKASWFVLGKLGQIQPTSLWDAPMTPRLPFQMIYHCVKGDLWEQGN